MNKNTIITILSIVIVVLAIALFNNYQDDQRYHYEVSQTMDKMKHDLEVMGNKIEAQANKVKQNLNETGNKIENKANKVKADLQN